MPLLLGVAGQAGPEKTAFMEALVAELAARGLKPGLALNSAGQGQPAPAIPRLEAGRGGYCVSGPGLPSADLMLARHFAGLDVVATDLHLDQRFLKLEICAPGQAPSLAADPGLRALVSDQVVDSPLPCFALADVAGLAAHLADKVLPPAKAHLVSILADGHRLPTKEFVEQIVAGTIRALVSSLKGAEQAGRLEIHL